MFFLIQNNSPFFFNKNETFKKIIYIYIYEKEKLSFVFFPKNIFFLDKASFSKFVLFLFFQKPKKTTYFP